MQQSVSAPASPTSLPGAEPWWPQGWWKIVDMRIGIVPIPIYVILCALLAGFTYTGEIKGEISVMIAVLVIGGFTCAEIGKRLPVLRNIGARRGATPLGFSRRGSTATPGPPTMRPNCLACHTQPAGRPALAPRARASLGKAPARIDAASRLVLSWRVPTPVRRPAADFSNHAAPIFETRSCRQPPVQNFGKGPRKTENT